MLQLQLEDLLRAIPTAKLPDIEMLITTHTLAECHRAGVNIYGVVRTRGDKLLWMAYWEMLLRPVFQAYSSILDFGIPRSLGSENAEFWLSFPVRQAWHLGSSCRYMLRSAALKLYVRGVLGNSSEVGLRLPHRTALHALCVMWHAGESCAVALRLLLICSLSSHCRFHM